MTLTGAGDAVRVPAAMVTSSLFSMLQVRPAMGRAFLPEEERPGKGRVAVLSDKLWHDRFGADPGILGKRITLDGAGYSVIGVMPAGFDVSRRGSVVVAFERRWRSRILLHPARRGPAAAVRLA